MGIAAYGLKLLQNSDGYDNTSRNLA